MSNTDLPEGVLQAQTGDQSTLSSDVISPQLQDNTSATPNPTATGLAARNQALNRGVAAGIYLLQSFKETVDSQSFVSAVASLGTVDKRIGDAMESWNNVQDLLVQATVCLGNNDLQEASGKLQQASDSSQKALRGTQDLISSVSQGAGYAVWILKAIVELSEAFESAAGAVELSAVSAAIVSGTYAASLGAATQFEAMVDGAKQSVGKVISSFVLNASIGALVDYLSKIPGDKLADMLSSCMGGYLSGMTEDELQSISSGLTRGIFQTQVQNYVVLFLKDSAETLLKSSIQTIVTGFLKTGEEPQGAGEFVSDLGKEMANEGFKELFKGWLKDAIKNGTIQVP